MVAAAKGPGPHSHPGPTKPCVVRRGVSGYGCLLLFSHRLTADLGWLEGLWATAEKTVDSSCPTHSPAPAGLISIPEHLLITLLPLFGVPGPQLQP